MFRGEREYPSIRVMACPSQDGRREPTVLTCGLGVFLIADKCLDLK